MTTNRSGIKVSLGNQRSARRHAPGTATNPDTARNFRYLQHSRNYQHITGDSPKTLTRKRLWLHHEHQAGRLSGKAFRELRGIYSKSNISKPKHRLPTLRGLTDDAKSSKRRLDEFFKRRPDASPSAGAVGVFNADPGDAGEMPSGAPFLLFRSHTNSHQAEEPHGDQVGDGPFSDGGVNLVAGDESESEDETETEKEISSDEDDIKDESLSNEEDQTTQADQAMARPANTAEANDAAARQVLLGLGIQLADYSAANQSTATDVGDGGELVIKRKEEADE